MYPPPALSPRHAQLLAALITTFNFDLHALAAAHNLSAQDFVNFTADPLVQRTLVGVRGFVHLTHSLHAAARRRDALETLTQAMCAATDPHDKIRAANAVLRFGAQRRPRTAASPARKRTHRATEVTCSERTSVLPRAEIPCSERTSVPPRAEIPCSKRTSVPLRAEIPCSERTPALPRTTEVTSSQRTSVFPASAPQPSAPGPARPISPAAPRPHGPGQRPRLPRRAAQHRPRLTAAPRTSPTRLCRAPPGADTS